MHFFRGIAVPRGERDGHMERIIRDGLSGTEGSWKMGFYHPGVLEQLANKKNLTLKDTRPEDDSKYPPALCACGEPNGALYYASYHNQSKKDDAPVMIEFQADAKDVSIDGRDFLYSAFQLGDPEAARLALERTFGKRVLHYAEKAWNAEEQAYRIAMCDLAIHDPEVIQFHYKNEVTIAGRHGTIFKNAFIVKVPVNARSVVRVWSPTESYLKPEAQISLADIRKR